MQFELTCLDYHTGSQRNKAGLVESTDQSLCSANVIYPVHAQDITDEAMISFKNHCVIARYVDRQYDKLWGQTGAKRGTTINLRYPPQYELRRGDTAQPQGSNESFFPVTLGSPTGVDLDFTSQEMLLTVDDFMRRFVKPAGLPVANGVDSDLAKLYKKVPNYVGTPGTPATALDTYLQITEKLAANGAPIDDSGETWAMITDYRSNRPIITDLRGLFNPQGVISKQFDSARMGNAIGYRWSQDQNIAIYTTGAFGTGTPLVNGANQSGASINVDGAGTVTNYWREGDVINFAGVNGIKANSVELGGSGESTGILKDFVVTADVSSVAAGFAVAISPSIVLSGPTQNVTGAPADNAAITTFGAVNTYGSVSARNNLAFHKTAFVLGMVDLPLPGGMDMAARTVDEDQKFSMRFLRGFDITENVFISRLDCLYVAACPRPEFAGRVMC